MSERMEAHKVNSEDHEKKVSCKVLEYLQKGRCGDVVLVSKIDGKRIWAHRMVLSACSEYFEKIFMNKETTIEELELEVDGKVLGALMLYCYFGEICELEKIAEDLMVAAAQYLIQPVVDACELYLADLKLNLFGSNWLQKMQLSERYNLSDLAKTKAFVCQHFMEISGTWQFRQLTFENVRNIISSNDLQVPCEEDVLDCVLSWLQHDWSNRQTHFKPLMECIRLSLLPSTFLEDKIWGLHREGNELMVLLQQHFETKGTISALGLPEAPRKGNSAILIVKWNSVLWSFCPQSGIMKNWSYLPLPCGTYGFGVALLGRNLIIAGGITKAVEQQTTYMYNLETKMSTPLSPMQTTRWEFSLVALNEFVYAIGGACSLKTVERLDPSDLKNSWEYVAPMSCKRHSLAAAVLEGEIYVAGGCDTKSVERYNPKTNKWTQIAPMNRVRKACSAVADNGYLYILGGRDDGKDLNTVERYDQDRNEWTHLRFLSEARSIIAAAIIGNRIFVMGGKPRGEEQNWIQEYNIKTNNWKDTIDIDDMPILFAITFPNFYSLNSI